MRRWVVRGGLVAAGVIVVPVLAFAVYVEIDGIPRYPARAVDLRAEATPQRLARGKKLATMLCAGCHLDDQIQALTGKEMTEAPKQFGTIFSRNITRDPTYGIGGWTDGQIAFLLRTGVTRDGRYLPPYMAKLPNMSDEDLASIIAFLRSDDPWVAPRAVPNRLTRPSFLTKALAHGPFRPLPYPSRPIPAPDRRDPVAHGRYLVVNLECFTCHSADFTKLDMLEPEKSAGYLTGGNRLNDANGRAIYAPNLTFDEETGIGRYTREQFRRTLRTSIRPDGKPLQFPMVRYPELEDAEVDAIFAYLGSLPRVRKARKATEPPPPNAGGTPMSEGKQLYQKYACQACHGDSGDGICSLRQANRKYPDDAALEAFIKAPQDRVPGSRMPRWGGVIKDEEFAPLLHYVRSLAER